MGTFIHVDRFDSAKSDCDLVITEPDFLEEIKACERWRGCFSSTTANYLRAIATEFGYKYDKKFNPYRSVVPSDYQGIPFKTPDDLSKIVKQMFAASYPQYLKNYLESRVRNRHFQYEHIIVVGFDSNTVKEVMDSLGFTYEEPKQVEDTSKTDEEILNEMLSIDDQSAPKKVKKNKKIDSNNK